MLSIYFHYFVIISPWKKMWLYMGKKIESPSPKNVLCQVWLELAVRFYRRRFLNVVNVLLILAIISLEKWDGHSFQQPWMSFTQGCYMESLVEINWLSSSGNKIKMWKVYRQTDGWTTDDGQQIRIAHLSLDELNTELCSWISTILMFNGYVITSGWCTCILLRDDASCLLSSTRYIIKRKTVSLKQNTHPRVL